MSDSPLIIGVSGKKQSGKTSLCEYLTVWLEQKTDPDKYNSCEIIQHDNGELDVEGVGVIEILISGAQRKAKIYNFADALKETVCHHVLGVPLQNLYGTDAQKNELTNIMWDNMPEPLPMRYSKETVTEEKRDYITDDSGQFGTTWVTTQKVRVPRTGPMTAREVMQVVGTDMFRNYFFEGVWVDATFRTIKSDPNKPSHVAFIPDVRFPSEVDAVIGHGGYVIRLGRQIEDDQHSSETALDGYDFKQHGDKVKIIDNDNLGIMEKNMVASNWLEELLIK